MIKVKVDSWHAKLWKYFHDDYFPPDNLCPYFWSFFYTIPLVTICWLLMAPIFICDYIIENFGYKIFHKNQSLRGHLTYSLGIYVLVGLIFIFGSFVILSLTNLLRWIFTGNEVPIFSELVDYQMGIIVICSAVIGYIGHLIQKRNKLKKSQHKENKTKPDTKSFYQLFKEYVSAKYHRYCPKIEWLEN